MQNQDHKKIQSPGLENHGVHVCHKCGWPFPKPHPSAKLRRAHKRVCGKVEGYKLIESEENPNLSHSDDDHFSDDGHKTASRKVLETSKIEKGSGGSGERLNRSEDELFSDAVMEFSESGQGAVTNEHVGAARDSVVNVDEMIAKNEWISTQTLRGSQIADLILSPSDKGQLQESELQKSTVNQPDTAHDSTSNPQNKNVLEDQRTEGFVLLSDHGNNTETDLYPVISETLTAESQENMNTDSGEKVTECSWTSDVQKTDEERNEAHRSDTNLQEVVISPGSAVDETSEPLQKIEETVETTSDPSKFDGVVQLDDVHSVSVYSELPRTDVPPEVEPVNVEGNENVHLLSLPGDLNVVDHPAALIQDFKDHKGVKLQHCATLDPDEVPSEINVNASYPEIPFSSSSELLESNNIKEGNENVEDVLSVLGDLNVVEHPEAVVKDFQDQGDVKDPISEESSIAHSELSNEGSVASSLHKEFVRNGVERKGEGSKLIDEIPIVDEVNSTNIKITPNEIRKQGESQTSFDTVTLIASNSHTTRPEEQKSSGTSKDLSLVNFPKEVTEVLSNVDPMDCSCTVCSSEDTAECALAGDDNSETAAGSKDVDDTALTTESAKSISEFPVNLTTDVHKRDDFGYLEGSRIVECDITATENREGPIVGSEEPQIGKISPAPESTNTDKVGLSDLSNVNLVSGPDQGVKEQVVDGDGLAQTEHVGAASTDAQSFFIGDVNSEEKTTKDNMKKEQNMNSVDGESFTQSSTTVTDNHAGEFPGDVAGNSSEPLLEECDSNDVKPQLSPCLIDVSVDSSSQTDSLEANWGSVSVLSTLSDIPIVTDAAEAEKTNLEKGKAASKGQGSVNPNMFEPPSFMTLVERKDEGNKSAADSEIQTLQNPEQPQTSSLKAGWFPSVPHTASGSPGRQKNEAIIAKVTNWSTGKQHTNLRSLLGEAAIKNKMKLPSTSQENEAPVTQKNEKEVNDNGVLSIKEDPVSGLESLNPESDKRDVGREWYPSDIKREKRKVKGRPIWTQFVCCSSVN